MPYTPLPYRRHKEAIRFNLIGKRIWRKLSADQQQLLALAWENRLESFKSKEFKHQPPNHTNESVTRAGLWNQYIAKRFEVADSMKLIEKLIGYAYMLDHDPSIIRRKGKKVYRSYLFNKLIEPMPALPLKSKTKGFGRITKCVQPAVAIRLEWGQWLEELAYKAYALAGIKTIKEIEASSKNYQHAAVIRHQQPQLPRKVYVWDNQAGFPAGLHYKTHKDRSWRPIPEDILKGCQEGIIKYEWANRFGGIA